MPPVHAFMESCIQCPAKVSCIWGDKRDQKVHPEPEAIMLPLLLLEGLHGSLREGYQRDTASLDMSGASWIPAAKKEESENAGSLVT